MKLSTHRLWVAGALLTATLVYAADKQGHAVHWGYSGKLAPDQWSSLSEEFSLCSSGRQQSPVELAPTLEMQSSAVAFHYQQTPLKVINNGHTIQINYAPGSYAELGGERYELAQFHFHSPSEHTIQGQHFDMEAHLVHRGPAGKLAVVGVLLKKGRELSGLAPAWNNLPRNEGEKNVEGALVDASSLLPAHRTVYSYSGSLTTPPCSEGVSWFVMAEPVEVSAHQIKAFRAIVSANARPVQPLYGRSATVASR